MYSCRGGTYLIIPVVSSRSFKSFYFPVAPGLFTGYPSLCFKERLRLQSSSQILKHLCDFSLPNVDLGLQSFQCSEIRSAQHWERRAAHLSENKGVKRECKKFGENSRQMLLFQRFVTSIAILVTNLETLVWFFPPKCWFGFAVISVLQDTLGSTLGKESSTSEWEQRCEAWM